VFAVFDLLRLNGEDLRAKPLVRRKRHLARVVPPSGDRLLRVDPIEGRGEELLTLAACDASASASRWNRSPPPAGGARLGSASAGHTGCTIRGAASRTLGRSLT
jgi:bifunctional non-homologous end joining protein LigD